MLGYFRRKREERKKLKEMNEVAVKTGDWLRAELDLYVELNLVARRQAFLEVFRGRLEEIDETLKDFEPGEVTRLEAAGAEFQMLIENWTDDSENLDHARKFLSEEFQVAEELGVAAEYTASVRAEFEDQKLLLMNDAMQILLELIPEAREA
jgi:hypothetical protein